MIDEARSSNDGMRAWGIAVICLANGLAGTAGSIPRKVACASVSATSGRAYLRAHASAHVYGSVNTGRGTLAVPFIISSSAISVKNAGTDAEEYGSHGVLGKMGGPRRPTESGSDGRHAMEEGGGSPRDERRKRGPRGPTDKGSDESDAAGEAGRLVVGWEEEEGDGHREGGDPRVGRKGVSS